MPPLPASEALPPVFPAQNFFQQRPRPPPTPSKQDIPQEFVNLSGQEFKSGQLLPQGQNLGNVGQIDENQRQGAKHLTETLPQGVNSQDEEEEVIKKMIYFIISIILTINHFILLRYSWCTCRLKRWRNEVSPKEDEEESSTRNVNSSNTISTVTIKVSIPAPSRPTKTPSLANCCSKYKWRKRRSSTMKRD